MSVHSGYHLIEKRFVKELNADCLLLEHIKSGAKLLKIASNDPNKTFSIAFKTIPETDAGTPHIMEHSVLNGSKNYPVKSPFEVLYKGSLNTFLNAMTYNDFTVYPVASMNHKDYFNLMRVYLDAVFHPLIYQDPRIFMQEGWHYELASVEDPLIYKGVVYNEMQGAFSGPVRELWYQTEKNLFPDNAYGNSSGGYPAAIPSLTYDDFLNYHRKYYHPSNCLIVLYGDGNMEQELECIDKEYLSDYHKQHSQFEIPLHKAFSGIKELTSHYPVVEGTQVEDRTYLTMSWVVGSGGDPVLLMCLDLLAEVLFNQESAMIKRALSNAGVGEDVSAVVDQLQQNIFSVIVKNANTRDRDRFKKIVRESLEKACKKGLDQEAVVGSLNRMEFRLREGEDANRGVEQNIRAIISWMYAQDPFVALEYEKHLTAVRKLVEHHDLEAIIKKELLDNPYGLLLTLEPKPGLEKANTEKIQSRLASIKKELSQQELENMVKTTEELIVYQKQQDSDEALKTIPLLTLDDIERKSLWYDVACEENRGVQQLVHHEFTNNIVYVNLWFDLRVLPREMIPYAALLAEVLGKIDTKNFTFEQLDSALNLNTGGFNVSQTVFTSGYRDDHFIPMFQISMKTTRDKMEKAMHVLVEIMNESLFNSTTRLREIITRHRSQLELMIQQNGFGIAMSRFASYLSQKGLFNELTAGLSYYRFMIDLVRDYDKHSESLLSRLQDAARMLFRKGNLKTGITCSESDYGVCDKVMGSLFNSMHDLPVLINPWVLHPNPANEGIATASKVQYVIKGYDFQKLGFDWDGKWNVLNHILSSEWLQSRIRVVGGAYGGFSGISRYGNVYFASYRDPNLKETLESYDQTVDFVKSFQADETTLTRFVIGTIARMDKPLMPEEKGNLAFRRYFEGLRMEDVQAEREAVLSVSAGDIRGMSDMVEQVLNQNVWCVYGNEDKLKANKGLFKHIINPEGV